MPNVILCDKVYLLIVLFAYLMHLLAVLPAFQVNTQEKGMKLGMQLLEHLWKEGRTEEISRVREDQDYRRKLLQEYGLI